MATVDSVYARPLWIDNSLQIISEPVHWAAIRPLRWLKGRDARAQITFCVGRYNQDATRLLESLSADGHTPYLFFLTSRPGYWFLNYGPGMWPCGAVSVPGELGSSYAGRIERALRAQAVDSLAAQADLVIVASSTADPTTPWARAHRGQPDCFVHVNRVVVGHPPGRVLPVKTAYQIDLLGKGPRLLFLRQSPDSVYEVVRSGAGSLAISGRQVIRLGADLERLIARIRGLKARSGRTRGGR